MAKLNSLYVAVILAALVGAIGLGGRVAQADTPLNVPLNNATASAATGCPTDGAAYWHFIIPPNSGDSAFAEFHLNLGGPGIHDTSTFILNGSQTDNVFVQVPSTKTLTSLIKTGSTADITWNGHDPQPVKFVLSGICAGTAAPTVTTEIHLGADDTGGVQVAPTSVINGTVVHDSAQVAGPTGSPEPTGNVTFTVFTDSDNCDTTGVVSDAFTLLDGSVDPGPTATMGDNGISFFASYSGDSTYPPANSACEPLSLKPAASATVVTHIHDAEDNVVTEVPLGSVVHDTVSVTTSDRPEYP